MKIGFFDSGIGGLTVLHETIKVLQQEDYIYYADTRNVPYGPKSKDEVRTYIINAVDFIAQQGVKAIVIACNTATSVAIEEVRARYSIPIIGMEPAIKPAIENSKDSNQRVLITATALTLKEEKLHNLIARLDNEHVVDLLPLPELVQLSEQLEFRESVVLPYLKEQLFQYDLNNYGTIVLGCTHFTYFKDMVRKLVPSHVKVIDGNMGTANNLKRTLEKIKAINEGSGDITFYHSGFKVEDITQLDKYNKLFNRLDTIHE